MSRKLASADVDECMADADTAEVAGADGATAAASAAVVTSAATAAAFDRMTNNVETKTQLQSNQP